MNKNELKKYLNNQLYEVDCLLVNHILSAKLIPNEKYMVESNQSEMKWNVDDNEVFRILDELLNKLNLLNKQFIN